MRFGPRGTKQVATHTALVQPNLGPHIPPPIGVVCIKLWKCRQLLLNCKTECCRWCITSIEVHGKIHRKTQVTWIQLCCVLVNPVREFINVCSPVQVLQYLYIYIRKHRVKERTLGSGLAILANEFTVSQCRKLKIEHKFIQGCHTCATVCTNLMLLLTVISESVLWILTIYQA